MKHRLDLGCERITPKSEFSSSPTQCPQSALSLSWPCVVIQKHSVKDQSPTHICFTHRHHCQECKPASSENSIASTRQALASWQAEPLSSPPSLLCRMGLQSPSGVDV